ncbi:N-6 DNA methylase [Clostridium botulinum]|jgi:type I restriction enzyme M protein|uniref:N-6 DNA methylase n=1 Tax=Clostridium botulinum TaxID=1491 RepID=UPI0007E263F2|nr:N-6 DNA methylase [Clostridium botulinum]KEI96346.1 restriction endonuclease subunit M [Clostridium botulinum F 357]
MSIMPLEADTRTLIDKKLENLGWDIIGKNKNVFLEQPRSEKERKKLHGKRPDYVLYSKENEEKPLIIIEAKKKGERIDKALEQGIYYAKKLEAPIVFATDGLFCKSYHTKFEKTPILNGEEVDEFLRESLALKYLNTWEVNTISPKVQYSRQELIKVFDEANNMLRGDGLRAGIERFGEFANILFLKLISESEDIKKLNGVKSDFNDACHWDYIKNLKASSRIEHINKIVYEKLNTLYNTNIFTPLLIRDTSILKEIMDKLDPLTLTDVDSDVKGDAFEYFLKESTAARNDLGEYFTPRHIVKTMVKLVNPQIGEKIYDPFCGTGGFLIETFRHIYNTMPRNETTKRILREKTIYGNEITNTARITKMNMILAGDGHSNIHMCDSLGSPVNGKYDIVLANMPYSQKTKHGNLYDLPSTNGDSICVQHCIKAINATAENGRMAIVVPEGFLFRKDLCKTRELLLKNCNLQSIISLPQGVFLPYTGVKTNIIYATKVNQDPSYKEKRKDYWYFEVKSDGYTLDNHRRKLDSGNDLDKYQEYRKLDKDQKKEMLDIGFEIIPFEKVKNNSYVLVGSRYREFRNTSYKLQSKALSKVATFIRGVSFPKSAQKTSKSDDCLGVITTKAAQSSGINENDIIYIDRSYLREEKLLQEDDILISLANSINLVGRVTYVDKINKNTTFGAFMGVIRVDKTKVLPKILFYLLQSDVVKKYFLSNAKTTTNISNLTFEDLGNLMLPIPHMDIQKQIVNELEGYQSIINGAKAVIENYKPKIMIDDSYNKVTLGDKSLFDIISGGTPSSKVKEFWDGNINWITLKDLPPENFVTYIHSSCRHITEEGLKRSSAKLLPIKTVVVSSRATIGRIGVTETILATNQGFKNIVIKDLSKVSPYYLAYVLRQNVNEIVNMANGATFKEISKSNFEKISVPLPPIEVQNKIVDQVEAEKKLIDPSKDVIEVFTKKIEDKINELFK